MCNWHLFILGLVKEHRVGLNGFQKFIEGHGGDLKLIMEQIWPCSLPDIKDMFKMSRCMLKTSSGSGVTFFIEFCDNIEDKLSL